MENFFYICLFIFGTLFGSFASVLIYRLKSGESGIMNGRSHCPKCNNILQAMELIPIFSWLKNMGQCHYCKEKISNIYPLLELSTGLLFTFIGYYLIDYSLIYSFNGFEITKLLFWLSIGFITILYVFYDLLFLEIHEGIMLSGILLIVGGLIFQTHTGYNLIETIPLLKEDIGIILAGYLAIPLVLGILGGLYIIMIKELNEWIDILILIIIVLSLYSFKVFFGINFTDITILSGIIGALIIFIFFFIQILISKGTWMGGGDLRIAIMIGLLLGTNLIFPALMITYMVGSVIGIAYVIYGKVKNKGTTINAQIPFGPFLAIGFFLTIFYNNQILNIMSIYF